VRFLANCHFNGDNENKPLELGGGIIYIYVYIYILFGDWFISSICKATVGVRWSTSPAPAASQNENDSVEMVK
jgi:hypothetical protein